MYSAIPLVIQGQAILGQAIQGQAIAQLFTERLLNSLGEGLAVALFAWIVLRLLRRQSSSTRFAVLFSTLIAIAALPLFEPSSSDSAAASSSLVSTFRLPHSWALEIFAAWALIASVGFARLGLSFFRLQKLRQGSNAIHLSSLPLGVQNTLQRFDARPVQVRTSSHVRVPMALGFFKPAIVLPLWALTDLDPQELNSVILHELAHLRRYDDWTNLAEQIVRVLFFFHPAVWWIGRSLQLEREMACDDFVLAGPTNPRAYAECLVSVAEKSFLRRSLALAFAAAGRMHQTTRRVARILDADRPAVTNIYRPALVLVTAICAVGLVLLPHTPKLVAFTSEAPILSASANTVPVPNPIQPFMAPTSAPASAATSGKMIPASFHLSAFNAAPAKISVPKKSATTARHAPNAVDLMAMQSAAPALLPNAPLQPRALNVSATQLIAAQPQSVLLVMQSEQFNASGELIYSFAVWHFTVFHPDTPNATPSVPVNRSPQHAIGSHLVPKST